MNADRAGARPELFRFGIDIEGEPSPDLLAAVLGADPRCSDVAVRFIEATAVAEVVWEAESFGKALGEAVARLEESLAGCRPRGAHRIDDPYYRVPTISDRPAGDEDSDARRRHRVAGHLASAIGLEAEVAEAVVGILFDPRDRHGRHCPCRCHPRLSATHDDGFDCHCTWDEGREAAERAALRGSFEEIAMSESVRRARDRHAAEMADVADWIVAHPGVIASLTCSMAPECWEGIVDGHIFFFRERWGGWRLELGRAQSPASPRSQPAAGGDRRGAEALAGEQLADEGEVIAEGLDDELGEGYVTHLAFIVQAVRDHLRRLACDHARARAWCPDCGLRSEAPA